MTDWAIFSPPWPWVVGAWGDHPPNGVVEGGPRVTWRDDDDPAGGPVGANNGIAYAIAE
jgi:hypothetical protein